MKIRVRAPKDNRLQPYLIPVTVNGKKRYRRLSAVEWEQSIVDDVLDDEILRLSKQRRSRSSP
jgi:hypothetical protein